MNILDRMSKTTRGILAAVLAAILFVALNILSANEIRTARFDLTADALYTVSEGTREVLRDIDEPITISYYLSRILAEELPSHGSHAARVRELLEYYADLSDGKLRLEIYNPEPYSVEEDEAVALGLQGVPLDQSGKMVYFGMAATNSTDDTEIVPFFDPSRERFLEYELTRMVYDLAHPKKRVIGLISSLPIQADPTAGYRPWAIVEQMRQFFDVRPVYGADAIDDDIDVLMIVHPSNLDDGTLYAIDQFVLGGGKAMIFVDPHSESMGPDPQGAPPINTASHLSKLFDAWGIVFDVQSVVGDRATAIKVNVPSAGRSMVTNYVTWMALGPDNINRDDVVTGELNRIIIASAGSLAVAEGAEIELIPLLQTSPDSMTIEADEVRFAPDPPRLLKDFVPEDHSFVLAARVTGKLKSAFPEGMPGTGKDGGEAAPEEGTDKEETEEAPATPHLSESSVPVNLIVVSDTDILADRFWLSSRDFFGQKIIIPTANNGAFAINALDNLTGSSALISLRSRGVSARPFQVVAAIQRDAEQRYRRTEQELLENLRDTEGKLSQLQLEGGDEKSLILSGEQKAAIDGFRVELVSTRQQLREVQHSLRKDIDNLDTILKILNIWAMPVAVSIVAIILAVLRQRRYRRRLGVN